MIRNLKKVADVAIILVREDDRMLFCVFCRAQRSELTSLLRVTSGHLDRYMREPEAFPVCSAQSFSHTAGIFDSANFGGGCWISDEVMTCLCGSRLLKDSNRTQRSLSPNPMLPNSRLAPLTS